MRPTSPPLEEPRERLVGERRRRRDRCDLVGLLDRAQPLDEPARRHQLDPLGQQLAQPRVLAHGHVRVLEPEPQLAVRQRVASASSRSCAARRRSNAGIDLLGRLLDVAEVGDEHPRVRADQREPVAAGVAGQVADVDAASVTSSTSTPASGSSSTQRARRAPLTACQLLSQPLERLAVAVGALARDARDAQLADHRLAPPRLARVDVGQVDLDRRQAGELERVADRVRVVRPGARVEHHPVGEPVEPVQVLDELALVVGLEERASEPELVGGVGDLHARARRASASP